VPALEAGSLTAAARLPVDPQPAKLTISAAKMAAKTQSAFFIKNPFVF
jgi:hypothetical protein